MKKAIITGITGQDGAYLAQLLLEKGYKVYGTYRRSSSMNFWRIEELGIFNHENLQLLEYDLNDQSNNIRLLERIQPDEFYNLAAQSFVGVSFDQPIYTAQTTGLGALHILEAIRIVNPKIRFYQASTSEMFGKVQQVPQTEDTPFYPRSPYAVAKIFGHYIVKNYRESYNMFACSGILFNHESPVRGETFVTRKITRGVSRIALGLQETLYLGNLDAKRDWGYAGDYVRAMWMMLQQEQPEDFVIATGRTVSLEYFIDCAFKHCGLDWREWVDIDAGFTRPSDIKSGQANPEKAGKLLGWKAQTSVEQVIAFMIAAAVEAWEDK